MKRKVKADYRPIPFWFLNHELRKEELLRQLDLMQSAGISGFFLHPRAGNYYQTYGSEEWFSLIRFIVEAAKDRGLSAWLYDEDPFPSGIAGGRVVFENPDFVARDLKCKYVIPDAAGRAESRLGPVRVLATVAVPKGSDGKEIDCLGSVGTVRSQWHKLRHGYSYYCDLVDKIEYQHDRAECFRPEMMLNVQLPSPDYTVYVVTAEPKYSPDTHGCRPDNLNPASVSAFLALTHEKYREHMGNAFGGTIPGIFLDEPVPGGIYPWTPGIEKEFFKRYGYELKSCYHRLFCGADSASRKVRLDYFRLIADRMQRNFYDRISRWCHRNGLCLTGHVLCEEDPVAQAMFGTNVYAALRSFDLPGFDIIGGILGDREHIALAFGAKLVSSVAHQQGKRRVMCEAFGLAPFNFGQAEMLRITNWLYSLGINTIVPHGFHYSYDGNRKFDAGRSFFYQHADFAQFPAYAGYAERMGALLGESRESGNVCLLLPMWDFFARNQCEPESSQALRARLFAVVRQLLGAKVEFDIADCDALLSANCEGNFFRIGRRRYEHLVLIEDSDSIFREAFEKKFESTGIHIVRTDSWGKLDIDALTAAGAVHTPLESVAGQAEDVFCLRKKSGKDTILFLFQNAKSFVRFRLPRENMQYVYAYDGWRNETLLVSEPGEPAEVSLRGYEALTLVLTQRLRKVSGRYCPSEGAPDAEYPSLIAPALEFVPDLPLEAVIDEWDVEILSQRERKHLDRVHYAAVRDLYGTELAYAVDERRIAGFDRAERLKSAYPVQAIYTAKVILGNTEVFFVAERESFRGDFEIYINDKLFPKERLHSALVYDCENITADISDVLHFGENTLKIKFPEAQEFDGIYSAIYFLKSKTLNFSV